MSTTDINQWMSTSAEATVGGPRLGEITDCQSLGQAHLQIWWLPQ